MGCVAAGLSTKLDDVEEDDATEESRLLRHYYHLRRGLPNYIDLPENLTVAEAKRLAAYVVTLPFAQ